MTGATATARIYPPRANTGSGVKMMNPAVSPSRMHTYASFKDMYFEKSMRSRSVFHGSDAATIPEHISL